MVNKMKFPMVCKGCRKIIKDEYDLWDNENKLCDICSMKQNSQSNKPIRTYIA